MADGAHIDSLVALASNAAQLLAVEHLAADKLLRATGIVYPHDGCAITLSILLQKVGIDVPYVYQALPLTTILQQRKWTIVPVGKQQTGDIGTTCSSTPAHGKDHIYLVLKKLNHDEMVIADNQDQKPHFRWASGKGGKTPTTYFLRAPDYPEDPLTLS
jgi:hypothetical protein